MKSFLSSGATHRTIKQWNRLNQLNLIIFLISPSILSAQELTAPFIDSTHILKWFGRLALMMSIGAIFFLSVVMIREKKQGSGSKWAWSAWGCFPMVSIVWIISEWLTELMTFFVPSEPFISLIQWITFLVSCTISTRYLIQWADQDE